MFALPGILATILVIYLRPQEVFPLLQRIPLLYLLLGLSLFGLALDLKLRLSRPAAAPQLPLVILFILWCAVTLVISTPPDAAFSGIIDTLIPLCLFLLLAHGVQTFRALQTVATTILVTALFLSYVGVDQRMSPKGCMAIGAGGEHEGVYDGRGCENKHECELDSPEPGTEYECEYVGILQTSSVGLRVRYRGVLADPNELALALGVALPFAFALLERKRNTTRMALLALSLGLIGLCTVYTQSRGGQLVFLSVLGTYFVRRYGWKGLLLGAITAAPMLAFGGRSGKEAEGSSGERLECWFTGIMMFRGSPVWGVGKGQFTEHHFLTAHNSYVLAPAELGIIGFWLWSSIVYLSVKIPIAVLQRTAAAPADGATRAALAPVARIWALALLASMVGMCVGIFFLSFCYHYVLWIYFGLCGALFAAVKSHDATFEVKISMREYLLIFIADLFLIAVIFVYTKLKI
jgi:O-antigen ligase